MKDRENVKVESGPTDLITTVLRLRPGSQSILNEKWGTTRLMS